MTTNTNLKISGLLKELLRLKAKYGDLNVCWDLGASDVVGIDERFATESGIKTHFNPALEPFVDLKDRP
jgi:hypothetical protein